MDRGIAEALKASAKDLGGGPQEFQRGSGVQGSAGLSVGVYGIDDTPEIGAPIGDPIQITWDNGG